MLVTLNIYIDIYIYMYLYIHIYLTPWDFTISFNAFF